MEKGNGVTTHGEGNELVIHSEEQWRKFSMTAARTTNGPPDALLPLQTFQRLHNTKRPRGGNKSCDCKEWEIGANVILMGSSIHHCA